MFKQRLNTVAACLLSLSLIFTTGCNASNALKGGAIGAGGGAIIGGVIGNQFGNTAVGAIIGAAVGGTAGALIGKYMDDQAAEMQKDIAGAKVERVGEGIKITFDSGILFQTNSSSLQSGAQENVQKLSTILKKYDDTNIFVEGHTDATGSAEYNQKLSEERALSVRNFTVAQGVGSNRFSVVGYGEASPVASNTSESGRSQNRRVEVAVFANDKLKEAAKAGNKLN
ncbi:MAG: OmpA family protein [Rhizobacter sp.]|nr:OmpA family protein [Chlorobiales bacterium]